MRKDKIKWVVTFVAITLLSVMVLAMGLNLSKFNTEKRINVSDYVIGAIDNSGKVVETSRSLYTKDLIKIDGFEIDVADDANIQFVVICYDAEEKFIGTVNGQGDMSEEKMTELGFNENTAYFRVVINPAPVDGEPVELNLFNKAKYADQLTITYKK